MAAAPPPSLQPQRQPPPPPPSVDLAIRDDIEFCHPGYAAPTNILLSLPRVDLGSAAEATVFGVHHRTALVACQIIAGNAFETGRLTTDREGRQQVGVPLDGILIGAKYYFIIDGVNQYPIVPSFQDWEFPHGRIPDFWPELPIPVNPTSRCAITNVSFAVKRAHLVPREEGLWYNRNGMTKYGSGLGDIDNAANILPLRRDLHKCFDDRWFAVVPETPEVATTARVTTHSAAQYLTHILSKDAAELWPEYHHTIVQSLHGGSRPYLFARFAWAVLLKVKPFVTAGWPRHVIRVHISNGQSEVEYRADHLNGPQLQDLYGGGESKAATPRKRKFDPGSRIVTFGIK
ncbi:hypothetical protein ACRE_006410 [Hapsidospora chrysogenum ATCC 11550]|uniref:HNH nuclease domain-containing protein n=1 Tax=Hapsidospora chrysogenum (strain ATCC 11550 / CBS 779.69 / DSM 880 / IAM 14645 / JCM 23072 / IMI 49137) TaxID=857340 RepID=A0A086TGR0_HAPC1|nr:hypothetical protein ACRE_006410 [Hapsidospora chrysogenum ATCC 11550]